LPQKRRGGKSERGCIEGSISTNCADSYKRRSFGERRGKAKRGEFKRIVSNRPSGTSSRQKTPEKRSTWRKRAPKKKVRPRPKTKGCLENKGGKWKSLLGWVSGNKDDASEGNQLVAKSIGLEKTAERANGAGALNSIRGTPGRIQDERL